MSRLALLNLVLGFFALFLAASGGAFLATTTVTAMIKDPAMLGSWSYALQKSAHGHTNLFGLCHVAFGLTLPYSVLPDSVKRMQTIGLTLGTLAMSVLMLARASATPVLDVDPLGALTGACLGAALCTLASHTLGLAAKLGRPYL